MYSPKRRFFLFRNPSFTGGGGGGGNVTYNYSWTERSTATTANYYSIEATGDFSTLVYTRFAATDGQEGAYVSTDEGSNWTRRVNGVTFPAGINSEDVAIARDNSNVMFIANRGAPGSDYIWRSTDGGLNWSIGGSPLKLWTSVSCSGNGSNVVATELTTSNVWVSYDAGTNWVQKSSSPGNGPWLNSFVSDDGTFMIVTRQSGNTIHISSDSGSNWSSVTFASTNPTQYKPVCSSNGQISMISLLNTAPRISRDYGATWSSVTDVSTGLSFRTLAMSRSGKVIAYAASNTPVFVSQDEGITWENQTSAGIRNWTSIAMDGSGSKIIVGPLNGKPWVGTGTA